MGKCPKFDDYEDHYGNVGTILALMGKYFTHHEPHLSSKGREVAIKLKRLGESMEARKAKLKIGGCNEEFLG